MGYYVDQRSQHIQINAADLPAAQAAVDPEGEYPSLEEWLVDHEFEPTYDTDGDIVGLDFLSDRHGDEDEVLTALAPFVASGSWIEWLGAEGEVYRHVFDGRKVEIVYATVSFP